MTSKENWWGGLYDELLADFLLENRTPEEEQKSAEFLLNKLELNPGNSVFDQCCGTGVLSLKMAEAGCRVYGVDQAETYIKSAQDKAQKEGREIEFKAADAFEYSTPEPCDAVFNWWTSFGYTMDDTTNRRMLEQAAASLKPGGRFLLDTMNPSGVLRHFLPDVVNKINKKQGEITLIRHTEIDWKQGAMLKTWSYFLPDGGKKIHRSSVKLYFPHTIVEMLRQIGFENIELFGDESGSPLALDSRRCIILARKKI